MLLGGSLAAPLGGSIVAIDARSVTVVLGVDHVALALARLSEQFKGDVDFPLEVAPNVAPVAAFSSSTAGLVVTFTDASTDGDGVVTSRLWTFGDSTTSTTTSPTHTYASPGAYTVTLVVTDDIGRTGTTSVTVAVTSAP